MKKKIECMKCNFKVEAELKQGTSLTPKVLESMARYFDFEILPSGYLCQRCKKKTEGIPEGFKAAFPTDASKFKSSDVYRNV